MADSDLSKLLKNMAVNVVDNTRHSSLSSSRKVYIVPKLIALPAPTPHFVLAAIGSPIHQESEFRRQLRRIAVGIVYDRHWSPEGQGLMVGGAASPPDREAELLIDALARPRPYDDGIHITGVSTYATQTNVLNCRAVEFLSPEMINEYGADGQWSGLYTLMYGFVLEYEIWRQTPQ